MIPTAYSKYGFGAIVGGVERGDGSRDRGEL